MNLTESKKFTVNDVLEFLFSIFRKKQNFPGRSIIFLSIIGDIYFELDFLNMVKHLGRLFQRYICFGHPPRKLIAQSLTSAAAEDLSLPDFGAFHKQAAHSGV